MKFCKGIRRPFEGSVRTADVPMWDRRWWQGYTIRSM